MPQRRRTLAAYTTALFLLAFLLLAGVGLLWVGCSVYSGGGGPTVTERLGGVLVFVDAMFLLMGGVAFLVYFVARLRAARSGALVSLLVSIASSSLLAVLHMVLVVEEKRRGGEFAGLASLALKVCALAWVILALLTWVAFRCVVSIRLPRR